MEMNTCRKCGVEKPVSDYPKHRLQCRACVAERQANWTKERREADPEEAKRRARENMRNWRNSLPPDRFEAYRGHETQKARKRGKMMKAAIYEAYGGYVCACCGESEPKFLSVDHVNNDGYECRKRGEHGSGYRLYNWLWAQFQKTGKWPDGFQILCMNCQHGKARNGGICPHKASQGVTTIPQGSRAKRPEAHRTLSG